MVVEAADVLVTVVHDSAVVAGEYHERIVRELEPVERGEHGAHGVVEFVNRVSASARGTGPFETRVGNAGNMHIVRGEEQEKWLLAARFDELHGVLGERVRHLLVIPAGRFPSGHPADAADAVDDGHVVPVGVLEFEQLRVLASGRFVTDFLLVTDVDRIVRIEPRDTMVLDIHGWNAVAGGRHDESLVEADFQWSRLDLAVPIRPAFGAQPYVPFADHARAIAGRF